MEPKPFASLSAGLLARKGAARPAMRRPFLSGVPSPMLPLSVQDDLGWNDMGEDQAPAGSPLKMVADRAVEDRQAEEAPPVVRQQQELEKQLSASEPEPVAAPKVLRAISGKIFGSARARASKAAFTLRLDPERHLRLRLACAVGNRSAQQIVTQALDAFLDSQPQLEALARQIPLDEGKGRSPKAK